ncbi:MAG TPA: hypothetical protein PK981_05845 [Accumulibacter sp.]|nr:hypothetical protein [Accumulibacter sp.]HMX21776.1 hypothetical protein [Accumulibacter sp.]HMY06655.1 hypothetical protein [Accumulibacter sp.]HNE13525.1 hypothetical protein [Accumulibacter sp.]HNG38550.1 hypothetical protein [Accumulibacter sp.]
MRALGGMGQFIQLIDGRSWLVFLVGVFLSLVIFFLFINPRIRTLGVVIGLISLSSFLAFPGRKAWDEYQTQQVYLRRLDQAEARFVERCASAGEKINRVVEEVEGLTLLKLRPSNYDAARQDAIDPYGEDYDWSAPTAYIATFLQARDGENFLVEKLTDSKPGYRYVDVPNAKGSGFYRYTAYMGVPTLPVRNPEPMFMLKSEPMTGSSARYGVTYEDITTAEDRSLWIAGSSLKVIDIETKEVLAERIGYMIDKGLGKTTDIRKPWTHALTTPGWSCPMHPGSGHTRGFVEKVLKIKGI